MIDSSPIVLTGNDSLHREVHFIKHDQPMNKGNNQLKLWTSTSTGSNLLRPYIHIMYLTDYSHEHYIIFACHRSEGRMQRVRVLRVRTPHVGQLKHNVENLRNIQGAFHEQLLFRSLSLLGWSDRNRAVHTALTARRTRNTWSSVPRPYMQSQNPTDYLMSYFLSSHSSSSLSLLGWSDRNRAVHTALTARRTRNTRSSVPRPYMQSQNPTDYLMSYFLSSHSSSSLSLLGWSDRNRAVHTALTARRTRNTRSSVPRPYMQSQNPTDYLMSYFLSSHSSSSLSLLGWSDRNRAVHTALTARRTRNTRSSVPRPYMQSQNPTDHLMSYFLSSHSSSSLSLLGWSDRNRAVRTALTARRTRNTWLSVPPRYTQTPLWTSSTSSMRILNYR